MRNTTQKLATVCLALATCISAVAPAISQPAKEPKAKPKVPTVQMSEGHAALCKVKVGDAMPSIELNGLDDGKPQKLSSLLGPKATVVIFWKGDRRMAREQLADMGPEVIEPFADAGVAVVGIAVSESADDAKSLLKAAKADFPNLLDAEGNAFAKVGSEMLPRTYVLDPQGKIIWFDTEYSLGTRRELNQALQALAEKPASE